MGGIHNVFHNRRLPRYGSARMRPLPFTRPSLGSEEREAVIRVLESGWITTGPETRAFEEELESYLEGGVKVRAFNSGTSALEASLLALGVGPGDEVIVPAMSFVASANVVLRCGATPRFVDVDPGSRNLDTERVEAAITPGTKAILPVHFAGRPVDMGPLYYLAAEHGLEVVEDAAQAIGSAYDDHRIGASGNPVCFSFHPNKNITTIEGGAVACKDEQTISRLERIRFHGIERDDAGDMDVAEWGGKMNLPDIGAALGRVQLKRLNGFIVKRRELAQRYLERLPRHPALHPPVDSEGHSWHMFSVLLDCNALGTSRKQFQMELKTREIATGVHYPAIHLLSLYRRLGYGPGDFPNAERIAEQTLTLPLFPDMEEEDVDRVCFALDELLTELGR